MENITPEEVRQIDMDSLASKIAEIKPLIEYVDILDRPPQLGCAYALRVADRNLGLCLCVKDRPSTQPMFVSANGNALIGGIKEKTILEWDERKTIKYPVSIPDSYELNEDWIFHGLLFKIDLESVKPHDVMLKLLK